MHRYRLLISWQVLSLTLFSLGMLGGCSIFTVKQEPFPPMEVAAERPAAPPGRVVLTPSSIKITEKIQFEFDSAAIKPESHGLLDEIVKVIQENPQIEQIRIEGHTDNIGTPAYNRTLSKKRAESVMTYFADKGVAKGRLVAEGFGPDRPIADNTTPDGQEKNRRVEFNIVKQSAKKTVVQEE